MSDVEPSTRVTLRDVYNVSLETQRIVNPLPARLLEHDNRILDHEIRIRAVEKYLWIWIGASGVIGAGAGQIINTLINN